ncbi:MAG: NAD-dependent epimerase/dehydratase family protein [Methyloligellaceae bacterium]
MRVLVTGGAGYIGSCVVEELVKRDYDVRVLDSFLWGRESLERFSNQIELVEGDVRSSADVSYALQDIDAVVHLAGIVGEQACQINPVASYTTNIESTHTLVNCMTDPALDEVRDLIFASSCSIYGNVRGVYDEVTETTPAGPLSLYAEAKVKGEEIIWRKAEEVARFHPTILRLTTLFGWSPRPRLDLVTNFFAYKALTDGELTLFGDGSQYRSLIHVRDVALAFVMALETPRLMRERKVFHVGDERNNRTVKEIAELVKEYLPETKINVKSTASTDRRDYKINCQRIRNVIDWERNYSVEDGVRDVIENLKSTGITYDPLKHANTQYAYK